MLLIVSALVIVTPQYVNAASNNDDSSCSHQNPDNSKKCSKNMVADFSNSKIISL